MPKHMNVVLQGYWLSNSSLSFFFYSRWSSRKILDYLLVIIHYSYNWDTDVYPAILQQYLTVNLQYSCISCIYLAELLHMTDICKNSSRNRGHTRDSWIYAVYLVRFRNREYATVIFWKSGTSDWYFASVFNMHCLSCKILAYPTYVLHNSHSSDASLPRSVNIQSYLAILRNLKWSSCKNSDYPAEVLDFSGITVGHLAVFVILCWLSCKVQESRISDVYFAIFVHVNISQKTPSLARFILHIWLLSYKTQDLWTSGGYLARFLHIRNLICKFFENASVIMLNYSISNWCLSGFQFIRRLSTKIVIQLKVILQNSWRCKGCLARLSWIYPTEILQWSGITVVQFARFVIICCVSSITPAIAIPRFILQNFNNIWRLTCKIPSYPIIILQNSSIWRIYLRNPAKSEAIPLILGYT